SAKYTSKSTILVETQKVPQGYVKPVITEDIAQRIATMQQQVLSRNQLQPMVERLQLTKHGKSVNAWIDDIRSGMAVEAVDPGIIAQTAKKRNLPYEVPGFYVKFTLDNPQDAQAICSELTSMFLAENLKSREQVAQGTTDFLTRQLEDSKKTLDDLDAKLANFKRQYMGQLPGDEDNN